VATVRAYWNTLKTVRNQIALQMGVDATTTPKEMRAVSNADLAAIGVVIKCLTDKGLITPAELQAGANAALGADGSVWDDEPVDPRPPQT
jgi:hypothetical protein